MSAFCTVKLGRPGKKQARHRLFFLMGSLFFCLVVFFSATCPELSWAKSAPDYQIKAGFIYRFLSFIDFPEQPEKGMDAHFLIGVMGDNSVLNELMLAKGHQIREKIVVVEAVDADAPRAALSKYHVMFIGKSLASRMEEILQRIGDMPMLTVSDDSSFIQKGGVIQFVTSEGKIRFIINLPAAETKHLVIHSRLKRVALQLAGDRE